MTKKKTPPAPDRQKTHGAFREQATAAIMIERVFRDFSQGAFTNVQSYALHMIATKLSRILVGDSNFIDHWADIAGYCERVIETLEANGNKKGT